MLTFSQTELLVGFFVTIITSLAASGGFWAFLERRSKRKDATTRLMLGLAHMKIVEVGLRFIKRGYVTNAEYQDYLLYLVEPYNEHGGNGLADQVFAQVKQLPIRPGPPTIETETHPH